MSRGWGIDNVDDTGQYLHMNTNTTKEHAMNHPSDCALCALHLPGEHIYVDAATQARRVAAAKATNDQIAAAMAATKRR